LTESNEPRKNESVKTKVMPVSKGPPRRLSLLLLLLHLEYFKQLRTTTRNFWMQDYLLFSYPLLSWHSHSFLLSFQLDFSAQKVG